MHSGARAKRTQGRFKFTNGWLHSYNFSLCHKPTPTQIGAKRECPSLWHLPGRGRGRGVKGVEFASNFQLFRRLPKRLVSASPHWKHKGIRITWMPVGHWEQRGVRGGLLWLHGSAWTGEDTLLEASPSQEEKWVEHDSSIPAFQRVTGWYLCCLRMLTGNQHMWLPGGHLRTRKSGEVVAKELANLKRGRETPKGVRDERLKKKPASLLN